MASDTLWTRCWLRSMLGSGCSTDSRGECEDHVWMGANPPAPTICLRLEALRGSRRPGTWQGYAEVSSHWQAVKRSGMLQAGCYIVGGMKLAVVGVFTPGKCTNVVTQGLFPLLEKWFTDTHRATLISVLCGGSGNSLWGPWGFVQGSGLVGGIPGLVVGNCFMWG